MLHYKWALFMFQIDAQLISAQRINEFREKQEKNIYI